MTNKSLRHLLLLIFFSVWGSFSFANITNYTYDSGNRASEVAGVMTTTYTYDSVNRLTQKVATGYGITYTQTLTYFVNGQIKTKTEKLTDNGTDVQDIAVTYTYDKLGRLTQSVTTDPLLGDATVTYTFDKVGNRLTHALNGVTTAYTYNQNDQLLSAGGITYTYDTNGNTLTQTEGGNTVSYTYDARNKLTSVTENGETTTFSYNPNGLRIGKKTTTEEINYLIDEQSGFGDVVAEYVNGSKAKTYTLGDRRISQTVGGETHYYGTDQQGSVKFLTNTSGLTDDYTYDSFGVLKNQSGTTDNDFRYTGEQFDATLNMYNLRARYYAPEIGRFYGLDTYQGQQSLISSQKTVATKLENHG